MQLKRIGSYTILMGVALHLAAIIETYGSLNLAELDI